MLDKHFTTESFLSFSLSLSLPTSLFNYVEELGIKPKAS
jgi:hypothetical protein